MRKTLFALLGLVAIGTWAVPALAVPSIGDPPKVSEPIPLENRASAIGAMAKNNYQATLSGTIIKQANVTTSWFLYPGACVDRQNGAEGTLGTWVARSSSQADSLNSAGIGSSAGYGYLDLSLATKIFGVVDAATPVGERPAILNGSRSLWFGFYDPNGVYPVGYPNLTDQILMVDLESDRAPIPAATGTYAISFKINMSLEQNYDYLYLIGAGDFVAPGPGGDGFGDEDPLINNRAAFDQIKSSGAFNGATLQATLTGSLTALNPASSAINGAASPTIVGEGGSGPATRTLTLTMTTDNRTLYFLIHADCLYSTHDGLWPFGQGLVLDDLTVTDTANPTPRVLYDEQTSAGIIESIPEGAGTVIVTDPVTATSDGKRIVNRVFPGKGDLWGIQAGNDYATGADICASKSLASDRFFLGVDPITKKALPGQFNSVVSCTFPVPVGTADITALWGEYLNLPRTSGYVQDSEYRFYKNGEWSNWVDTNPDKSVVTGAVEQWFLAGDQLAQAVQADSVQIRYNLRCIPAFAADGVNCDANTEYGVLYDDFFLQVTEGVPAPVIGIFPGAVAQTTFVDGFMTGTNCTVTPCWPGIRGSDLQTNPSIDIQRSAVKDNVNSPLGDSLTMVFVTGLRKNGMGINWHFGFDKGVGGGLTIAHTNSAYNSAFDTPRVIYRLFDPATTSWSAWDSTSLDATNVAVSGPDTTVIDSEYRMNWPPRDKGGQTLPGGFTLNGEGNYDNLDFLPRGTRMQYYFKAVDKDGGTSYGFGAGILPREVEDLPTLPGSSIIAPDIQVFEVLPRKYPVGTGLTAGVTHSPILNLDDAYGGWSFQQDPVTAALRGMGVRADRYRFLGSGDESHKIGGHELTGDRPERQSNYFPNIEEYGIVDSLRSWYRILIENSHLSVVPAFEEQDAQLVSDWAATPEPSNDGDRCIFLSADDASNAATNGPDGVPNARKLSLSTNIFGIANVTTLAPSQTKGAWAGNGVNFFPTIDDQFAAQASGPGLAAPGSFTYEVDGGCPGPNRFDPLTTTGTAFAAAKFPVAAGVTDVAAVANAQEFDTPADFDQVKTLAYGYSIQFVRGAPGAIPRTAANYVRSGVQNRMQILYKFLTGCRGARSSGSPCWPCPTDANMMSDWSTATGFNTATYGPLLPIQDFDTATGIGVDPVSEAPKVNQLFGNNPNPFNPRTQIKFSAAQAGKVTIRIFNVAGQLVRTLETKVDADMVGKTASVSWDGKTDRNGATPSGVYFYKATFANGATLRADRSMVLVK